MTLTRKKLIILVVWVAAVIAAIIATVFSCGSSDKDDGDGNGDIANKYSCIVTFDMNGGRINDYTSYRVEVEKGTLVKRPSEIPYAEGYVFWGWNTTGYEYDPMWQFDVEKITDDMTIYAVWVKECTVTFYADGGTFEDGTDTYTFTIAYGDKLTAPKVTPPDESMELAYWANKWGDRWDFSEPTIGYFGVELYAHWDLKKDIRKVLAPFRYTKTDDGYRIDGIVDKTVSGALTVPDIVTSISPGAFAGCDNLTSIVISDSVTEIGQNAFQNCKKLKSVTLPSGLTSIEDYTFDGCSSLERIRLTDTLTKVGSRAFQGCTALTDFQMLATVKNIGGYAFAGCTALTDVKIPVVVTIDNYAFQNCAALKKITVPATCILLGAYAFKDCTQLASVELHCKSIRNSVFDGCTAITEFTFGDEVQNIGSTLSSSRDIRTVTIGNGIKEIPALTFSSCAALRNVTIGSGVQSIGMSAFQNCASLQSITIPSSVQSIGSGAFMGCQKLVEVYNLSSVSLDGTSIDTYAAVHTDADDESIIHTTDDGFSFCMYRDKEVYPYSQTPFLLDYSGGSADIVLPDNYNGGSYKIFKYALSHNRKLNSVKFSAGVKDVKENVLYASDNVTKLIVDSANPWLSSAGNCVINTADKKFILGCKTSVIPTDGSVTTIGNYVFCANEMMGNQVFKIPDTVTQVERYAFNGCSGIMRTVNHIVYVDKWAIALGDFDQMSQEKLDLQFQSGTVGIAEYAFFYYNCIRSVTFNDDMRYVGSAAFFDCKELTSVNFNDGLLIINGSAFYDCEKLQEAVLPDSVTTVGWGAFYGCTALAYAKLPAAFNKSNTQIFYNCHALNAIVIPQSIEHIGYSVFLNCPDTVNVYYCGSEQQWNAIEIENGNTAIINATKYFYSETEIEGVNCWHYGADGRPTTVY
ncbi:MAG: leucine-rich repeat protein [Clostridiales bacterium]|nr:leucine-rich repeat protein [Clostridiales bacterium]